MIITLELLRLHPQAAETTGNFYSNYQNPQLIKVLGIEKILQGEQEKQKESKKKKREENYIQFRELYIAMHRDDEGGKMNLT